MPDLSFSTHGTTTENATSGSSYGAYQPMLSYNILYDHLSHFAISFSPPYTVCAVPVLPAGLYGAFGMLLLPFHLPLEILF